MSKNSNPYLHSFTVADDTSIDGKNLWDMIKNGHGCTTRTEVVYDICSSCNSGGGMHAIR